MREAKQKKRVVESGRDKKRARDSVGQSIPCTCDPEGRLLRLTPDEILPFQGVLKSLAPEQSAKLARSMRELGFSFPEFVWRHPDGSWRCLDGHQRLAVLAAEGIVVEGGIPVVEISAADEQEAAKKLLVASSTYGKIEPQGLYDFTELHGVDLGNFDLMDLPEIDMEAFHAAFDNDASGADGSSQKKPSIGVSGGQLTAVIYSDSVDLFERALRATGEINRAEAVKEICEHYLEEYGNAEG